MSDSDRPTFPNVDCYHKIAEHRHGTHACYVLDRCRCQECRGANHRYEKARRAWLGEFPKVIPPLTDVAPVRAHCLKLMSEGMGLKRIAEVAGVTYSSLGAVVYGRGGSQPRAARRIRSDTAALVLAVTLDLADGAKVDGAEARAIVRELRARGWSKAEIARRLGAKSHGLQVGKGPGVFAGTLRKLRGLLDEPVPLRVHNPTGRLYRPNPDYKPRRIPASTRGVPSDWYPGSPAWLAEMRAGLKKAVEESYERHGRFAA